MAVSFTQFWLSLLRINPSSLSLQKPQLPARESPCDLPAHQLSALVMAVIVGDSSVWPQHKSVISLGGLGPKPQLERKCQESSFVTDKT